MESMEKIRLNNGVQMPPIGYGVYRMTDPAACEEAVVQVIRTGYRLIDTAAAYGNEEAVGRAIRRCGVPREEIFLTTKLWIPDISYEGTRRGLEASLRRLGQDSVDLYVIHQPYHDLFGAWRAMEELYEEGKVRAIGVDNFTQDRLADFLFWNKVPPAVDLLECNPFCQREGDLSYLRSKNILLQAWSPLAAGQDDLLHNETLARIGARHQKSAAQVVLRWLTQRGIVPLVKSANPGGWRKIWISLTSPSPRRSWRTSPPWTGDIPAFRPGIRGRPWCISSPWRRGSEGDVKDISRHRRELFHKRYGSIDSYSPIR